MAHLLIEFSQKCVLLNCTIKTMLVYCNFSLVDFFGNTLYCCSNITEINFPEDFNFETSVFAYYYYLKRHLVS